MDVELPSSWARVQLDDILSAIVGGGTPPKDHPEYFQGDIPLMTVKDMRSRRPKSTGFNITREALQNSSAKLIPADTLIIATRMGLGKVVRVNFETAINQDLKALFPLEGIDKSFLEFWLISIANKLEEMGTGTTVKGIRLNDVKGLAFPLAPTKEQSRIVEKIETLFAQLDKGEEAVRQVQVLLKRYRQSVLQAAVTGELTKKWRTANQCQRNHRQDRLEHLLEVRRDKWEGRGRYKEPAAPEISDLPVLPDGWIWASPDQLSAPSNNSLCIGPFGSNLKVADYKDEGVPLIFVRNIRAQNFSDLEPKFVSHEKAEELASHQALPGDLLITKMGEPPGDVCIYPKHMPPAIITADCIRLNVSSAGLSKGYLEIAIRSPIVQAQIKQIAKGVAQQKVNLANFRRIAIPLPPLEEQVAILTDVAERNRLSDVVEEWCAAELPRSTALRQSILKEAFAGRLVSQDPAEEPANELLKRIRASNPVKKTARPSA